MSKGFATFLISGILGSWATADEGCRKVSSQPPASVYFLNHIHSNRSDDNEWAGKLGLKSRPSEICRKALGFLRDRGAKGVIAVTDHDRLTSLDCRARPGDVGRLQPVCSIESGGEGSLHRGLIGLSRDVARAADKGGYLPKPPDPSEAGLEIVNHPAYHGKIINWSQWGSADAVEIQNGPSASRGGLTGFFSRKYLKRAHNPEAFELWLESLAAGKCYTAVGGTDYHMGHSARNMFYPANVVFTESNDPQEVLQAVREGKVCLQLEPRAPKLSIQAALGDGKPVGMGGHLTGGGKLKLEVRADFDDRVDGEDDEDEDEDDDRRRRGRGGDARCPKGAKKVELWVYDSRSAAGAPMRRLEVPCADGQVACELELEIPEGARQYLRVEARRGGSKKKNPRVLSITNPVYVNYPPK